MCTEAAASRDIYKTWNCARGPEPHESLILVTGRLYSSRKTGTTLRIIYLFYLLLVQPWFVLLENL